MVPGAASLALRDEIPPMIYVPIAQSAGMRPPGVTSVDISVRASRAAPGALASSVGAAFSGVDPNLSLMIRPLADYVDAALAEDRVLAMLSGFFGFVGLLLAGLGIYGVTSYSVHVRRAELEFAWRWRTAFRHPPTRAPARRHARDDGVVAELSRACG
jgi:hypothetical protein